MTSYMFLTEPPVATERLEAIEAEVGIKIPDEYRRFLLEVAGGHSGGRHNLWSWEFVEFHLQGNEEHLATAWPHDEKWDPYPQDEGIDPSTQREAYERWREDHWDDRHVAGSMAIGTFSSYGTDHHLRLVVTGSRRGELWSDDRSVEAGISFVAPAFGLWFEQICAAEVAEGRRAEYKPSAPCGMSMIRAERIDE